jgi:hypothetical protein
MLALAAIDGDYYPRFVAWEWASPASGAVVGVAGLVGGWWVTASGRRQEVRLAAQRRAHELKMSHEQWHRDRRADAYVALLEMAETAGQWVQMVHPFITTGTPPLPELPSLEQQSRVWARVAAYAAPEVRETAEAWRVVTLLALRTAEAVARDKDDARRPASGAGRGELVAAVRADAGRMR